MSQREGRQPRWYLLDPSLFGIDPDALWRPLEPGEDVVDQVAAYWHHLAVCTLRQMFPTQVVESLASRLGRDNTIYLRRQVSGEYRVGVEDLIGWAIAFDDISLLRSVQSVEDLYPPSRPE